jgi:hypothetical protein
MKISAKLRHRITLVPALTLFVVGVLSFADFSGQPAPRWREILLRTLVLLAPATTTLNKVLDRRDSGSKK